MPTNPEQAADNFFDNAPEGYSVPKGDSKYMKFEQGDNKFRFLLKPIFGWLGWKTVDGKDKPFRFRMDEKPTDLSEFRNSRISHFWAMPVWNFQTKSVEILEITQKTILKPIENFARNEDWGSPLTYSLNIHKEGTTKEDTAYIVTPSPHKDVPEEVLAEWTEVEQNDFDLTRLFDGGDPFSAEKKEDVNAD